MASAVGSLALFLSRDQISTDPPARGKHRHVIDVLRAFAALSVCIYHFSGTLSAAGDVGPWVYSVTSRGHLGVPVFFVISGFVIPLSMGAWRLSWRSCGTFLGRRMLRLYPPYLIASVLGVGMWWLSSLSPGFRGTSPSVTALQFLASATMTAEFLHVPWLLVVAWTLAIEVQFYLAITLLLPLLLNYGPGLRLLSLSAWIALPLAVDQPSLVTAHSPLFGMGIAAYLFLRRNFGPATLAVVLLAAGLVQSRASGLESSVAGLLTAAALLSSPRPSRVAAYLGGISYSLYLVHVPVGGRLVNLGLRLPDFPYRGLVIIAAALAGSLLAADVFFRVVEQRWIARSRNLGRAGRTAADQPVLPPLEPVRSPPEEVQPV